MIAWVFCSCIAAWILGFLMGYLEGKSQGWSDCSRFYRGVVVPAYLREVKFLRKKMRND